MKKANNQGFSLVELIIVVAIMAVLIGVLAPQFLRYVERTRVQKDASAVEELRNAAEIALSTEAIYQQVTGLIAGTVTEVTIDIDNTGAYQTTPESALLETELGTTIGPSLGFDSNAYRDAATGGATITITENATAGTVNVETTAP